jgi:predicted transcriptional regulator
MPASVGEGNLMTDQIPTTRELQILRTLWEIGPASVREVHEDMCPHGELAFNTTQTLMRIMDEKGLVTHEARGRRFIYRANYSPDREMHRLLETVFQGAMDQFVASFLKSAKPSSEELAQIEEMIADARRRKRTKGRKKQ